MARTPYVGGNWKMNTDLASATALVRSVVEQTAGVDNVEIAVFPPFPYLLAVGSVLRDRSSPVRLGAQDIYPEANGAFTGEVSAAMLADCCVSTVLAGHSERRHVIGESDELINRKVRATLAGGLDSVLCIGETLEQREAGQTDAVNERQLRSGLSEVSAKDMARVTIAYEPVWAIGTGKTATPEDAQNAHERIRTVIDELYGSKVSDAVRIQYGGSMKPGNAPELMGCPDIDGGLIGGAALKAEDFAGIIEPANKLA